MAFCAGSDIREFEHGAMKVPAAQQQSRGISRRAILIAAMKATESDGCGLLCDRCGTLDCEGGL
jgi:hypothetical protein